MHSCGSRCRTRPERHELRDTPRWTQARLDSVKKSACWEELPAGEPGYNLNQRVWSRSRRRGLPPTLRAVARAQIVRQRAGRVVGSCQPLLSRPHGQDCPRRPRDADLEGSTDVEAMWCNVAADNSGAANPSRCVIRLRNTCAAPAALLPRLACHLPARRPHAQPRSSSAVQAVTCGSTRCMSSPLLLALCARRSLMHRTVESLLASTAVSLVGTALAMRAG